MIDLNSDFQNRKIFLQPAEDSLDGKERDYRL